MTNSHETRAPIHCGHCRDPLPDDAVSDYFCGRECQEWWHAARSEPLNGVTLHHRWRNVMLERRERAH